jgi:hypothetical protein
MKKILGCAHEKSLSYDFKTKVTNLVVGWVKF